MSKEQVPNLEVNPSIGLQPLRGRERMLDRVAVSLTGFVFGVLPYLVTYAVLNTVEGMPEVNVTAFSMTAGFIGASLGGVLAHLAGDKK